MKVKKIILSVLLFTALLAFPLWSIESQASNTVIELIVPNEGETVITEIDREASKKNEQDVRRNDRLSGNDSKNLSRPKKGIVSKLQLPKTNTKSNQTQRYVGIILLLSIVYLKFRVIVGRKQKSE